jgi:small subunit ribosomal protein S21
MLSGTASAATLHKRCPDVLIDRPLSQTAATHGKGDHLLVQVIVRDNNVDQALKALKKKMQREGIFREMKRRRSYEKPSEKRAREQAEAVRRARKLERKRVEREGF